MKKKSASELGLTSKLKKKGTHFKRRKEKSKIWRKIKAHMFTPTFSTLASSHPVWKTFVVSSIVDRRYRHPRPLTMCLTVSSLCFFTTSFKVNTASAARFYLKPKLFSLHGKNNPLPLSRLQRERRGGGVGKKKKQTEEGYEKDEEKNWWRWWRKRWTRKM